MVFSRRIQIDFTRVVSLQTAVLVHCRPTSMVVKTQHFIATICVISIWSFGTFCGTDAFSSTDLHKSTWRFNDPNPAIASYRKVPRSIPPGGMTFSLEGLSLGWKIPFPLGSTRRGTRKKTGGNTWPAPSLGVECHSPRGNTSRHFSACRLLRTSSDASSVGRINVNQCTLFIASNPHKIHVK